MSETGVQPISSARPRRTPAALLRHFTSGMMQAIRVSDVRLGLLGTILLALGSLTPAYLPQSSPYWGPARALGLDSWPAKAFGTAMVMAAVGLLMVAWFRLRLRIYAAVKHWAVLVWWSLPLLFAPPIFSHDAYSYAAQGWLICNGYNPYQSSPSMLPGPFADQVAWVWRYTMTPYGPLALQISHGLVLLAGQNPYYSAVAHRIPALIGVALIVTFLPRIARIMRVDPRRVAWFSTINPLLIIDFVGGAHNDALMLGLVVTAIFVAYRGRMFWALCLVGVAAAIKQPAFLAAYPIAIIGSGWASWKVRHLLRFAARALYAAAVAVGVFCAISVASGLGFGWLNAVSVPGMIVTMAPFSLLGWAVQSGLDFFGVDPTHRLAKNVAQSVGLAIMVVVIGYLAVTRSRTKPITFLSWAYLAVAIFGPALQPWYLTWGGLLLPLTRPTPRIWRVAGAVVSVLLVYGAGNLAWRNDAVALVLAALAAAGIVLYRRREKMKASGMEHDDGID